MYEITYEDKKYSTQDFAKKINKHPATVTRWLAHGLESKFIKEIGCMPKIKKTHFREKTIKGPKKFVVYEVKGTNYKFGIDVAFGKTNKEATEEFMYSRSLSDLKFKVLKVCKDRNEALKVRGWLTKYE